ncbi:hypothetical protein AJ80_07040 [Polytolypa hystricis UAMH7299]|uniref:Uncharacterized protein n=1 Tax=Polytolypa hystricis (strain UAMH7299) TaxID=1447883 RepID=A0A2B7XSR2_POLH7|nr:hypothetical protein AJ80_07040 [Polytolypa hystricis UAMH7299]
MSVKVITLTGAPRRRFLDWDESGLLNSCCFCDVDDRLNAPSTADVPRWREVRVPNQQTCSSTKLEDHGAGQVSFFKLGQIDRYSGQTASMYTEDETSHFYDHSFAMHEGVPTVLSGFSESYLDTSAEGDTLDLSVSYFSTDENRSSDQPAIPTHLSDLEDIPRATYLSSIAPRTINVNLIVAIITINHRRRVRTRWGNEMDIVEVVVGDETRTGFGITCWLRPEDECLKAEGAGQKTLESSLRSIRPRDVVLFRCVALNSFQGQVYGQSLRNNITKVDLLHRIPVDSTDSCGMFTAKALADEANGSNPQAMKVRRVRDWVLNFVSPNMPPAISKPLVGVGRDQNRLVPPDTP